MGPSDIVNYGKIISWIFAAALWLGRVLRGEKIVHPALRKLLSSNVALGALIFAGLLSTAWMEYRNYSLEHEKVIGDVSVSAYPVPGATQEFQRIADKTYENETVPLDGFVYDHVTFDNVCLFYKGGSYELQHVTFKNGWKVCSNQADFLNYMELLKAMHLTNRRLERKDKNIFFQHP